MRRRAAIASLVALSALAAACGDDDDSDAGDGDDVAVAVSPVESGVAFPDDRCEANRAAGTINYFTGFDFAAAASIIEVVVADARGYYGELCLDVQLTPGFSVANLPLVASNEAQFSSAGNFTELAAFAESNGADLVALSVDGHAPIDVLMVHPELAESMGELHGATLGVKGALPPAVAVMLRQEAGLAEGDDFSTVLLDGFDPIAHWQLPDLAGVPGWRSNEPGALQRAGLAFDVYDPIDHGIPGSFGLIYTNQGFLDAHPTAAEDFMRAAMKGLAEAIADPEGAAAIAVERINAGDNPNFLSPEGETFRWVTDAETVVATTPEGSNIGVPIGDELRAQLEAYAEVGYFGDADPPPVEGRYHPDLVADLYDDDGNVIWPG
jgi:NitT/TauT family transport system substrate-binding protein